MFASAEPSPALPLMSEADDDFPGDKKVVGGVAVEEATDDGDADRLATFMLPPD